MDENFIIIDDKNCRFNTKYCDLSKENELITFNITGYEESLLEKSNTELNQLQNEQDREGVGVGRYLDVFVKLTCCSKDKEEKIVNHPNNIFKIIMAEKRCENKKTYDFLNEEIKLYSKELNGMKLKV